RRERRIEIRWDVAAARDLLEHRVVFALLANVVAEGGQKVIVLHGVSSSDLRRDPSESDKGTRGSLSAISAASFRTAFVSRLFQAYTASGFIPVDAHTLSTASSSTISRWNSSSPRGESSSR